MFPFKIIRVRKELTRLYYTRARINDELNMSYYMCVCVCFSSDYSTVSQPTKHATGMSDLISTTYLSQRSHSATFSSTNDKQNIYCHSSGSEGNSYHSINNYATYISSKSSSGLQWALSDGANNSASPPIPSLSGKTNVQM